MRSVLMLSKAYLILRSVSAKPGRVSKDAFGSCSQILFYLVVQPILHLVIAGKFAALRLRATS
jgi:hypothetical protein